MDTVVRSPVEVRIIHGHHSVCAAYPLAASDTVLEFVGMEASKPGRHSIQIGKGVHLFAPGASTQSNGHPTTVWQFLNHSCVPNTFVHGRFLIALRDIPAGADVTYDYNTTEWDLASPFECWCGHASCVGLVRGFRWLSGAEQNLRREFIAQHLLEAGIISAETTNAR